MFLRRIVGISLVIAAMAGIIFSIVGLIGIWRYRPVVTQTVLDNLALAERLSAPPRMFSPSPARWCRPPPQTLLP